MAHYYNHLEANLKELNELSVNSLGVVRKNSATAMSNTSKILVVGLGGMGLSTVHELKKTLVNRIGNLRESDIQFLAFDTAEEDINAKLNTGPLTATEARLLLSPSLASIMDQAEELRPMAFRDPMPPANTGYNPTFDGQGAAQVRLTGRLSIMDTNTYKDITTALQNAITKLGNFTSKKLEIHVISGIGGGTGSGLCVDIPYIIRHVADTLHIPDGNRRLFGHIFLPNVYDSIQHVNHSKAYRNGYAALKEIDYYMNIGQIYETFDAIYPDGPYSTTKPIFNFCTLIGGHISAAIVMEDTKKAAINTCVENLVNQVTYTVAKSNSYDRSSKNSSMADIFTSASFLSNVDSGLSTVLARGTCNFHKSGSYKYSYIGSSTLKFPTEAIIEYFTGEVFKKTVSMLENNATTLKQSDVDEFEKNLASPAALIKPVFSKYDQMVENAFSETRWNRDTVESGAVDSALSRIVDELIVKFDEKKDLVDKVCATAGTKAAEIFKNPAKGPYFLARLLTANAFQGSNIVGFYEKLDKYSKEVIDVGDLTNNLNSCRDNKDKLARNIFGVFGANRRRLDEYKDLVRTVWKYELQIRLYKKLADDYYLSPEKRIGICYHLRNKLNNEYLSRTDILTHIGVIMDENAAARKDVVYDDSIPGSIFCLTDAVFDSLKNSVRHNLDTKLRDFAEVDVRNFAGALLNDMIVYSNDWSIHGINPLASAPCAVRLRDFLYNYEPFADITGKSFTDYFENAYRNETDAQKDKIVRCIADYLDTNASPMCNVYAPFSWIDVKELCHRFMIIPNNMDDSWGTLFTNYLKRDNQNILLSPDQNAMCNYTLYAAMPMWIHGDLAKYETQYYTEGAGVHINESLSMDPPYIDYPPLMPRAQWHRAKQGLIEYVNKNEIVFEEKLNTMIEKAKLCQLLKKNEQGYYVLEKLASIPDTAALEKFFKEYTADKRNFTKDDLLMGDAHLYSALKEAFGTSVTAVNQIRTVKADDEANLPELIRLQMKLLGKMKKELTFINSTLDKMVNDFNGKKVLELRQKEVNVFMLYGLISVDERGLWYYTLGDRNYNIISKLQVTTDNSIAHLSKYMELVIYKRFYELEKINEHLILLNKRKNTINESIYTNPNPADFNTLKNNYEKYTTKANKIVSEFELKIASGINLTNEEMEIKTFYETTIKNLDNVMSSFSAD